MNIIITGASRGIGFELVKALAKDSSNNIIAISRNKTKLQQLKQESYSINSNSNVSIIDFDLTKIIETKDSLKKMIDTKFPNVDILINNAGYLFNSEFEKISSIEAMKIFNTNFFASAELIKLVLPSLNQNSHVVNIGSMGGFQGASKFSGLAYYSASKAALANLTECLAEEYKERKISFNYLALGAVQTEMLEEAFPNYKAPVSAKEMANFIAEFALNGNKYMNGKIIPVALSTP